MVKATIVKMIGVNENGVVVRCGSEYFTVKSLDKERGTLEIDATTISTIYETADIVKGCFEANSTFEGVRWVTFKFNTITVTVTLGEALGNSKYIVDKWKKAWNKELNVKDE